MKHKGEIIYTNLRFIGVLVLIFILLESKFLKNVFFGYDIFNEKLFIFVNLAILLFIGIEFFVNYKNNKFENFKEILIYFILSNIIFLIYMIFIILFLFF